MGVPHICLPPFGTHQSVPLVLGRFARVVFLDAGPAVGGSSQSSARFFWISLFHDICLSRRFSSLLERKISVCYTWKATRVTRDRRIVHTRQQENRLGATYRSLRSKLGSGSPVSATWPWTMSRYGGRRPDLLAHRWKIKVIPLLMGVRRRPRCFVDTQAVGLPVAIFLVFVTWIITRFRTRFLRFLLVGCDFGWWGVQFSSPRGLLRFEGLVRSRQRLAEQIQPGLGRCLCSHVLGRRNW